MALVRERGGSHVLRLMPGIGVDREETPKRKQMEIKHIDANKINIDDWMT